MSGQQSTYFPPVAPAVWIVCIPGFLQPDGKPTGMMRLWQRLGVFRSPRVVVALRAWNSDWAAFAEHVWRVSVAEAPAGAPPVRILVFAYSWGVGYGFVEAARELGKRGIEVEFAGLSDGVYRSRWFPRLLAWLALTRFFSIPIPKNVRKVAWLYQRENRPWGRRLRKAKGASTEIPPGIRLERTHQYMDDAEEFHRICLQAAWEACGEQPGGEPGGQPAIRLRQDASAGQVAPPGPPSSLLREGDDMARDRDRGRGCLGFAEPIPPGGQPLRVPPGPPSAVLRERLTTETQRHGEGEASAIGDRGPFRSASPNREDAS